MSMTDTGPAIPRAAQLGNLVEALCDEFGTDAVCAAAVGQLRSRRQAAGADPRTGEGRAVITWPAPVTVGSPASVWPVP
ncbi:MAG TPA: hypothetical protein VNH17_01550 [Streptosporangiaceae bacterium]|nr:hypothetical protein [Streptosporangiaceae bacterium]